jgi:hypothetical protein
VPPKDGQQRRDEEGEGPSVVHVRVRVMRRCRCG